MTQPFPILRTCLAPQGNPVSTSGSGSQGALPPHAHCGQPPYSLPCPNSMSAARHSRNLARRTPTPTLFLLVGLVTALLTSFPNQTTLAAVQLQPLPNTSVKTGKIVISEDRLATYEFNTRLENIGWILDRGMAALTGQTNMVAAWRQVATPTDTVGIKVLSAPGATAGTRKDVVAAVIRRLLNAGIPARQIIVWDQHLTHLKLAGYKELEQSLGIRLAGSSDSGYDPETFYETPLLGRLVFGDLEFGKTGEGIGRKSYVSKLVSKEITRIISIPPMLNHNEAGISGHLLGLALASVDNTLRFETDPSRLASAVPEIFALPAIADKLALCITDALFCQYHGEASSLLHYSVTLNQLWLSRDPVATDLLGLRELERHRSRANAPRIKFGAELYSNAGLLELGASELRNIEIQEVR